MIIAIDGPAGSGKSTVAQALAKRLGLTFLDTGAMYRAVTLEVLRRGIDPGDSAACGELAETLSLTFDDEGAIWIDGRPGEPEIRAESVTAQVSAVSAHPAVRQAIVPIQRRIGHERGVVAEGRDTTTVVFADADLKVYLVASLAERARRRAAQVGRLAELSQVQSELAERDDKDQAREHSPLRHADDAMLVVTDGLGVDEIVERMVRRVQHLEPNLADEDPAAEGEAGA